MAEKKKAQKLTAAQLTKKRSSALELMTADLRVVYREIETKMSTIRASTITTYHELGKLVKKVKDAPETYSAIDGTSGMALLTMVFRADKSTLLKAAQFATMCDDEEVRQLLSLNNEAAGFRLTWKHIIYLITVETKSARLAYAESAVKRCLDPAMLSEMIQKKSKKSGSGGRPHNMPKSIWAMLTSVMKVSKDFVSRQESVWDGTDNSIFTELVSLEIPDEVEYEHVETAQEIAALMTQISAYAQSNANRVLQVAEHLQELINKREQAIAQTNSGDMEATNEAREVHA